jgi:hypothetical protein
MDFNRRQILIDAESESVFLWGARQTGKSTLLKQLFPKALWFDLLLSDVYERLSKQPSILRETILAFIFCLACRAALPLEPSQWPLLIPLKLSCISLLLSWL